MGPTHPDQDKFNDVHFLVDTFISTELNPLKMGSNFVFGCYLVAFLFFCNLFVSKLRFHNNHTNGPSDLSY